jgi:hypothetical protein
MPLEDHAGGASTEQQGSAELAPAAAATIKEKQMLQPDLYGRVSISRYS